MAMGAADKLIAKAAREILKPAGLFQAGVSRIWIDDNGWFLTVVEFQPSSWSKGAYLNVAMSLLWEQGKGFAEILPYNIGGREMGHEQYKENDEVFHQKMLKMAQHAKMKVENYREYSKFNAWPAGILNGIDSPSKVIKTWDKGMFCYLCDDEKHGDEQMELLLKHAGDELEFELAGGEKQTRDWVAEYARMAERMLLKTAYEKNRFVVESIIEKRRRLRNKPSYRKLPVDSVFQ